MPLRTLRHAAAQLATTAALTLLTPAAHAQAPFPPDDCGDTRETARPISPGQTIQGRFDAKGFLVPDVDVYRVEAPVGRIVKFTLEFIDAQDAVFMPDIFNSDGRPDLGINLLSRSLSDFPFTTSSPRYLYAKHAARPDGTPVRYTVSCIDIGADPGNATPNTAQTVLPNTWYAVGPERRLTDYWIRMPVRGGQAIAFDARTQTGRIRAWWYQSGVLFERATRGSGSEYFSEASEFSPLLPGRVAPADGSVLINVPTYDIVDVRLRTLAAPRDPDANTFANPTPVSFNNESSPTATITGSFDGVQDSDYFTVFLTQGRRERVTTAWPSESQASFRVIDPDGVTLRQSSWYPFTVERTGLHRIVITGDGARASAAPSTYVVTVRDLGAFPGETPEGLTRIVVDSPPTEYTLAALYQNSDRVALWAPALASGPLRITLQAPSSASFFVVTRSGFAAASRSFTGTPGATGTRTESVIWGFVDGPDVVIEVVNTSDSSATFRVGVNRALPEPDDFPNIAALAPIIPLNTTVQMRYSQQYDVDYARVALQPGRLYSSLSRLTIKGDAQFVETYSFVPAEFQYVVDRPTEAIVESRYPDTAVRVDDVGSAPSNLIPVGQVISPGVPTIVPPASNVTSRGFTIAAAPARVYGLVAIAQDGQRPVEVRTASPWPARWTDKWWFQTPTSRGNPALVTTTYNTDLGRSLSLQLSEIAAPALLPYGTIRSLTVGETQWAYSDLSTSPGSWSVMLEGNRAYLYETRGVSGVYQRSEFPEGMDLYAGFADGQRIVTSAPRMLRISGPRPGSAASVKIIDLGPLPADDIPSPAEARRLRVGTNTAVGSIDYTDDTDWFTLTTDRIRKVRIVATSDSASVFARALKPNIDNGVDNGGADALLTPGEATTVILTSRSPLLPAPIPYSITVTPVCDADIAGANQSLTPDGQLTADDLIVFLSAYLAGEPRGDVAGFNQDPYPDNQFTADDLIVYINAFFAGC